MQATPTWSAALSRYLVTALGTVALLAVAACSSAEPDPAGSAAPVTEPAPETGFDECSLLEPAEAAELLGTDAMYVTARAAMTQSDGSPRASCRYFPEDVPGMLGMELATVTDTDPDRFFAPFERFTNVETVEELGDRTEAVKLSATGTRNNFIEIRTIEGNRGLHLYYAYREGDGTMPEIDGRAAALLLTTALDRLPDEVVIPPGAPEGRCADVDLGQAAETLGGELVTARSVGSAGGAMSCHFSGGGALLEVIVVTDAREAEGASVGPDLLTHPDIGDGARVVIAEGGALQSRVNLGDRLVRITATHAADAGTVTALRPTDLELVRGIVDGIDRHG
ncbi:hypothetical protein ACU61A_01380 [Pseudonocardia sichuanensis]